MNRYDIINYNKGETRIFIPNEIFDDLQTAIQIPTHLAFAYSYYYMITYLYRYNKYFYTKFTQSMIKEFLGVNPIYKKVDYIIKKGGVLDTLGYTETTTDYPISCTLTDDKIPMFKTIHEWKYENPDMIPYMKDERNFKIKYPVKAFFRDELSRKNDLYNGTFYEARYTHGIHVNTFVDALEGGSNGQKIGYMGFYLYGFISALIGQSGGHYVAVSINEIGKQTKLSHPTLVKTFDVLEKEKFLKIEHQEYKDNQNRYSNVYRLKRK